MAQLSLYIEDEEMETLKADAASAGKSTSSYVADILRDRHNDKRGWINGWPPGYFDLFGSSPNFPDIEDYPIEPIYYEK